MKESMQLQDTGGARDGGADDEEAPDQPMPEFTSNVGVITFDFAMQNVALQMGLRLLTAGGLHVKVGRWPSMGTVMAAVGTWNL